MLKKLKTFIALDNPFRLLYHKLRAVIANLVYRFPSKEMTIIWVTGTNGKTTTSNIIAKSLQAAGKKVFMFTTVNIIIWDEEYTNNSKMTSPDAFYLQKLLYQAKQAWCEIAVIETASHGIKMHRVWWIDYDISVLTNITQDHLDLHKTMEDYVNTKLQIFEKLITYNRKPWVKKSAIINAGSKYADLFIDQTYDSLYTYWTSSANLQAKNIVSSISGTTFDVTLPGRVLSIQTSLIWDFNVENILAAIWVGVSLWIDTDIIKKSIAEVTTVPGRMDEVYNDFWYKIFVDYAHTQDALEKVLSNVKKLSGINNIITVFWATWDRDKTKRPLMGQIVDQYSDKVILTQDDDYTEDTMAIIKDVLPWINRKQSENFWVIPDRKQAIRTAIVWAEPNDVIVLAGKWDEHVLMTNAWPIEYHEKTFVQQVLQEIDSNSLVK